jgi:hypothetical protein
MTRDRWTTVAVGAVLIVATFMCPYTRSWTEARPRQHEGFRPVWRQATGPPEALVGKPGTVLVLWRVTCVSAAVEATLFALVTLLLRPRHPGSPVWPVGLLGLTLYLVACAVPVVYFDDGPSGDTIRFGSPLGLTALALGWLPPFTVAWAANPVWLFGIIGLLRGKDTTALICGCAASLLGLATLVFAPPFGAREHPLAGYYLWQASLVSLAFAGRLGLTLAKSQVKPDAAHDLA